MRFTRWCRESLKAGGRLALVDNWPRRTLARPRDKRTNNHVLSPDLAVGELEKAGFHIPDRQDTFIDNPDSESAHWFIAAEVR
jgi:hypothetical protein